MSNIGFGWLSSTSRAILILLLFSLQTRLMVSIDFNKTFWSFIFKHTEKENKSGKTFQTLSIITPALLHHASSLSELWHTTEMVRCSLWSLPPQPHPSSYRGRGVLVCCQHHLAVTRAGRAGLCISRPGAAPAHQRGGDLLSIVRCQTPG